ncbi:MAG TPA: M1 family metallopeptidase, partial [Rhodothermales bacterium]|nr:M1 family metallopeptidase [Rhodothermales bacterium]
MLSVNRIIGVFVGLLILAGSRSAFGQVNAGYQPRVRYDMDVTLQADRHHLRGTQRLVYYNDTPDTLRQVFYHLFYNAFNPHSMMAERNRHLPDPDARVVPRIFNLGPDEVGYQHVRSLTQDGRPVPFEVNDTVMRVELLEPILPGDSARFDLQWDAQVPLLTRRGGRDSDEGIDFSMSQWYPKMAMYDHLGWHADMYIGREFYAPFGSFDVRITLPSNYVLGGTGTIVNPDEVGHGYDTAATTAPPAGDSLTWHFHAENVHDFAWVADPDYIHERFTDEDGHIFHLLYQPGVAATWKNLREWVPAVVQFYTRHYGPYPWPQFTVAQAGDGGMEYPMITFITGRRSPGSVLGTMAHETGHMWFYGVVASNETDYAWMDEGFANYISTEALSYIDTQEPASHARALLSLLGTQHYELFEPLNTPSDWFVTNQGYGTAAYAGGESVLEMLGYVISPPLRDRFLKEYFRRFAFRHPYPADVEKVAEDVSGLQLDWFFDQVLNRKWMLDYGIDDVASHPSGNGGWTTSIELERHTDTVFPVDLALKLEDGSVHWVNVPLVIMEGHKPMPRNGTVAEAWPWTSPEHTITVDLPSRPVAVYLDPLLQTPDDDRLDNEAKLPRHVAFLRPAEPSWTSYGVGWRPLAQFARGFGGAVGLQARGQYIYDQYQVKATLKLWPQILAGEGETIQPGLDGHGFTDGIDYELALSNLFPALGPYKILSFLAQKHLGFLENAASLHVRLGRFPILQDYEQRVGLTLLHQFGTYPRPYSPTVMLPLLPQHTLSAVASYELRKGGDVLSASLEVGSGIQASRSAGAATRFTLGASKSAGLGPLLGRASLGIGLGTRNLGTSRLFRLGMPSALEAWHNDAYRALASAFVEPVDDAHLVPFSGTGPVAYALGIEPTGTHVLAGRVELQPAASPLKGPWLAPLSVLAFGGLGKVWDGDAEQLFEGDRPFLADAGVGLSYDVSRVGPLQRWVAQSDVLSSLRLA